MTIIFPSPIFGPIHSRRLGVSLGINLLPDDGKVCSFDCIYCECGFNAEHRTKKLLPTREEVRTALEEKLKDMQANGPAPDVLTFAGNGEPTAHPHFPEIIEDTLALRDRYFPKAKVSVLSNSTFIDRPAVFEALNKIDNNILKLDTVDEEYIHLLDRPNGKYSVKKIIERMKEFKGNCIVQTMFLKGSSQGKRHGILHIRQVSLDRSSERNRSASDDLYKSTGRLPMTTICKATHEELDIVLWLYWKRKVFLVASY